jgi:hypothetical protein
MLCYAYNDAACGVRRRFAACDVAKVLTLTPPPRFAATHFLLTIKAASRRLAALQTAKVLTFTPPAVCGAAAAPQNGNAKFIYFAAPLCGVGSSQGAPMGNGHFAGRIKILLIYFFEFLDSSYYSEHA